MIALPAAFEGLRQWPQFTLYKVSPDPKKPGKLKKLPVAVFDRSHDERGIDSSKPYWWVDADTAINQAAALGPEYGVAFRITANDPFFLVDIDNCANGNAWSPLAIDLLNRLHGAAVEVSASGTGLHIIGSCAPFDHGCRNESIGLECYTKDRFIALTGAQTSGSVTHDCSATLPAITMQYIGEGLTLDLADWTTEPRADWAGFESDQDLIEKACTSGSVASVFNVGWASFYQLWHADEQALAAAYPDPGREYNASQADAALAQHLAFWTGANCERIESLMRQSALARDKWDDHKSYLSRTILKAAAHQKDVHQLRRLDAPSVAPAPTISNTVQAVIDYQPEVVSGYQFLAVDQQIEHFKGCVYVQSVHAVLTPDGVLLKPDQFRATYGGYLFALDANNEKTTKNPWEAFVESQAVRHLKVHRHWFRPDQAFGQVSDYDGFKWVNTYLPVNTPCVAGDVEPFLTHLRTLLPDQNDQAILLNYMAAVVQFPGIKFQWAPLIQGAEGNGKTLFTRCVAQAIGERYSHMPRADEIGEKYNEWLFDNIFIGVEDIHVPDHKRELMEVLKPMITNERLEQRGMGSAKIMKPLCANFIFNSNHQDAVRKTRNDRRFAPLFCAQQSDDDIARDMAGDYFPRLYAWLRNGGYSHVTHYLKTFAIDQRLNPAVQCGGLAARAPQTTSTDTAINQSLGRIEQEILEAVETNRPGFAGGWVSSTALDRLLDEIRAADRIPRNKRRLIMFDLGYGYHPALDYCGGRATQTTTTDGNKPRLFIKRGHPALQMTDAKTIVEAYDRAQQEVAPQGDPAISNIFGKNA